MTERVSALTLLCALIACGKVPCAGRACENLVSVQQHVASTFSLRFGLPQCSLVALGPQHVLQRALDAGNVLPVALDDGRAHGTGAEGVVGAAVQFPKQASFSITDKRDCAPTAPSTRTGGREGRRVGICACVCVCVCV